MSHCINPNCSNRQNSDDCEFCQTCGTKLLINERYQIVKTLRIGQIYNSEVFEVKDLNERGTLKILKSLSPKFNNSKAAELFEKEAQVLIWLSTDWHKYPGIPKVKPDAYFSCNLGNGLKQLKCLAMEKIEGQNLEQWLEENQCVSQEKAINWLEQLINILDKVHQQGLWHRDIKPSNIMLKPDGQLVLIDFGAVGIGNTVIASAEYTPPEQVKGATVLQSDFFAIGRTFVYLLTGNHPHNLPKSLTTEKLIWRTDLPKNYEDLANLIDDLMAPLPENRPKNTQEILQRIQSINNSQCSVSFTSSTTTLINPVNPQPPTDCPDTPIPIKPNKFKRKLKVLGTGGIIVILGIAVTVIYNVITRQTSDNLKQCLSTYNDDLSFGEEILVPGSKTPNKSDGVKAISSCDYVNAVKLLEQSRANQKNEPETLIYLNNARIEAHKTKAYTIAVLAPLSGNHDNRNSGLEILRGVAQAQDEVNQDKKNTLISLRVLIGNDKNDVDQGKKLAENIGKKDDILGVIGHATSDVTVAVADTYKQNKLVLVSPMSTADELSTKSNTEANFFFRTVSSDRVTAQALTSYLLNSARKQKAAVYYNSNSSYSSSLKNQFITDFSASGGNVIDFDLSTFLFSATNTIKQAQKQGISTLVLLPDSTTRTKAVEVIKANSLRYLIIGGDSVYHSDILKMGAQDAVGLVVAIPWHNSRSPNLEFPQAAQKLWGGSVSWRTAFAYDATRTLIAALEKTSEPSRTKLQQTLSSPNFQVIGATGEVRFRPNGDRKDSQIQLVKVEQNKQRKPEFVPSQTTLKR